MNKQQEQLLKDLLSEYEKVKKMSDDYEMKKDEKNSLRYYHQSAGIFIAYKMALQEFTYPTGKEG